MLKRVISVLSLIALVVTPALSQGDPATIARILDEGKNRNRVMEHLTYLATEIGARLTGSHSLQRACEWTRDQFESYGLEVQMEQWTTIPVGFQRGPNQVARMISPEVRDFHFTTRAWSPGTFGPVKGVALPEPDSMDALRALDGKLKGAWIMMRTGQMNESRREIGAALDAAGIAGRVVINTARSPELVLTGGSFRDLEWDNLPTSVEVSVRGSDHEAVMGHINAGHEVILEFDIENYWLPGPVPIYNVIADIRGTEFPDEYVIISGHLDSWDGPGSQGVNDNGTGTMVALEAARILMASGARPKRTIRFIMWTGEEQGLLGSREYVRMHEDKLDKISAVFVDDGGTGYSGGLTCIAAMEPMLRRALEPVASFFPDMPVTINVQENMPRGGGSDHAPFNAVGVPGFFWRETGDLANYSFVHHTQHDHLEHAVPQYLVQSSTVSAVIAYNLAMADTLLPRAGGR